MYNWKILELIQADGQVLSVKYRCEISSKKHTVATEGNWKFRKKYDYPQTLIHGQSIVQVQHPELNLEVVLSYT